MYTYSKQLLLEWMEIYVNKGARQRCLLSPFNVYAELLLKLALVESTYEIRIDGEKLKTIKFADDQGIIPESPKILNRMVHVVINTENQFGSKINIDKTTVRSLENCNSRLQTNGKEIQQV